MLHLVRGVLTVVFVFRWLTALQKRERIRRWALDLLAQLAIKLVVIGVPPVRGPVLLAANHVSWLDIVLLLATCNCRFVSKADVRHWPLIGRLAAAADTLFVERTSRQPVPGRHFGPGSGDARGFAFFRSGFRRAKPGTLLYQPGQLDRVNLAHPERASFVRNVGLWRDRSSPRT